MILKLAMILMWTKPSLLVNMRPQSAVCVMSITRVYYEKRLRIMILGLVLSGSWDKTVHCIDIRDSTNPVVLNQPDKVYTMSVSDSKYIFSFLRVLRTRLVVGTANRMINVYDLKNLSEPLETRESTLLYQTRCIECSPNDKGICCS